ncbi:hypothetical protein M9Y10_042390 [Tritrichomonas musculus]|uniref:Secreted protein n=1 Tax=Tritrichomonas musculus TaxID=1915356 RepID=A0ABR2GID7_9EUKA
MRPPIERAASLAALVVVYETHLGLPRAKLAQPVEIEAAPHERMDNRRIEHVLPLAVVPVVCDTGGTPGLEPPSGGWAEVELLWKVWLLSLRHRSSLLSCSPWLGTRATACAESRADSPSGTAHGTCNPTGCACDTLTHSVLLSIEHLSIYAKTPPKGRFLRNWYAVE